MVAAHVLYARPFTTNYGFGKLENISIPTELQDAHDRALEFRHKVFAHRQLIEAKKNQQPTLLDYHNVLVKVKDGMAYSVVSTAGPSPQDVFKELHGLSTSLLKKVEYHSRKWFKKYSNLIPKRDGTYQLVMDEGTTKNFLQVEEVETSEGTFSANLPQLTPTLHTVQT